VVTNYKGLVVAVVVVVVEMSII